MSFKYFAALPWYDHSTTRHSLDLFWQAVAQFLLANGVQHIHPELQRTTAVCEQWQSPNLLLGQCCGPDLFTPQGSRLQVIARPVFSGLHCRPDEYYSHIVARDKRPSDKLRLAVNSLSSRSGYGALLEWMHTRDIKVADTIVSGSHTNSLSLLAHNNADIAAIDAHLVNQFEIQIDLPIIGRSKAAPAPPYVCHGNHRKYRHLLYDALQHAINLHRDNIRITDLITCERHDYGNTQSGDVP